MSAPLRFAHPPLRWLFEGNSVDLPFHRSANPTGSFSVELWAACRGTLGHQCLVSSREWGAKAGYIFYVEPDGVWSFWVGTGKTWEKLYGSKVVLGRWTHLRGTVDTKNKEARFYVDHQLVARGWASYVPNTKGLLRLGGGAEAQPKFFFTGDLKEVCVLGRVAADKEDLAGEKAKLLKAQDHRNSLEQLPRLLRESGGSKAAGTGSGSALAAALKWATAAVVPSGRGAEDFRREALRFLESSPAEGARLLFLSFSFGAVLSAEGDELQLNFAGTGQQYWAVIVQAGHGYKILYEADEMLGSASLPKALARQKSWRKGSDGWLSQKDVAMWLSALDTLAFSLSQEDLEEALLTVFLYGFWAEKSFTPQVRLKRFEASRSSKIQALLVEMSSEALIRVLQQLTEEVMK